MLGFRWNSGFPFPEMTQPDEAAGTQHWGVTRAPARSMPPGAGVIPGTAPGAAQKMGLDLQKKLLAPCQDPLMRTDWPAQIDAASSRLVPAPVYFNHPAQDPGTCYLM